MMNCSIIEYYAEHEGYKCGYCKKSNTSYSHGLWAHTMTVSDYQDLIDRGWRRSGKYCYKPTLDVTCCPSYTIRCKALEFKATKSQKKILKRFNKYLSGNDLQNSESDGGKKMSTSHSSHLTTESLDDGREDFVETKRNPQVINIHDIVTINCKETLEKEEINTSKGETSLATSVFELGQGTSQCLGKKDTGPDPTKAQCKKAKIVRREKRLEKLKEKGIDVSLLTNINKNKEKQIEDLINELAEDPKHKLEIKLVRTNPPSSAWLETAKETHKVYVKYQMTVHGDTAEKCSEPRFKDFLVQSPLLEEYSEIGPSSGYGSFHQQYWLDGKIIAVGVIDILPKCVSSVYFFYDPQYMNLTLGTYGALREIAFTRQLNLVCPELKYYYLGFYIHSCPKMRYKGNFHPSYLLCPETYKWFPIKECLPKLDQTPYSRLDPDIDSVDENYPKDGEVNYIPILFKGTVLPFKLYRKKLPKRKENIEELNDYARLVGSKTVQKLVLVR